MIVLRCDAVKSNGLRGKGYWYVAGEDAENGRPYATISQDPKRAMPFSSKQAAADFNEYMLAYGNFAKPFDIIEIKDDSR